MYSAWIRQHRRNIGIPIVLAALILAKFNLHFLWISVVFIFAGESIRIWAAGHLRKEEVMTTGGPYRIIRNPLYLGSFLIAIGFCLVAGSIWIWILMFAYFLFCYIPVIRYEETILNEKFSQPYSEYASAVPAFYPTVRLYANPSTKFSWKQVLRNKEYNAILGIAAIYLLLYLKTAALK